MTRGIVLIVLGVLIALALFSGLPLTWLTIIIPVLGIAVALIGYTLRVPRKRNASQMKDSVIE